MANDPTKKYYEPKAPAEKAMWAQHFVKRYTEHGTEDSQYKATNVKKDKSRKADQRQDGVDNPLPGLKEKTQATIFAAQEALAEATLEKKVKVNKPGHPKHGIAGITKARRGPLVLVHHDNGDKAFYHENDLKEEAIDEAFPPAKTEGKPGDKATDPKKKKKPFGGPDKKPAPTDDEEQPDDDQDDGKQPIDGDKNGKVDGGTEKETPVGDPTQDNDEDGDDSAKSGTITAEVVKSQLEKIALQAAELYTKVDEADSFDESTDDGLATILSLLEDIEKDIGGTEDTQNNEPDEQNSDPNQAAGTTPAKPDGSQFPVKEDVDLNEVSKQLLGRYVKAANANWDHHRRKQEHHYQLFRHHYHQADQGAADEKDIPAHWDKADHHMAKQDHHYNFVRKREKGLPIADKKLAKEETDLDEVKLGYDAFMKPAKKPHEMSDDELVAQHGRKISGPGSATSRKKYKDELVKRGLHKAPPNKFTKESLDESDDHLMKTLKFVPKVHSNTSKRFAKQGIAHGRELAKQGHDPEKARHLLANSDLNRDAHAWATASYHHHRNLKENVNEAWKADVNDEEAKGLLAGTHVRQSDGSVVKKSSPLKGRGALHHSGEVGKSHKIRESITTSIVDRYTKKYL